MQIPDRLIRRVAWLGVIFGFVALISALGVFESAAQGSENLIWACRHNRTGVIVIVDAGASCPTGWTPMSWNVKGEQGPQGVPGSAGPPGDSHWKLTGSVTYYNAGNVGIGTTSPAARLYISSGSGFSEPQLHLQQTNPDDLARLRFTSGNASSWDIAVGRSNVNYMNFFVDGRNVMTLKPNGDLQVIGKVTSGGLDPPYISFSNESHTSIRQYARDVESHEKVMQFWNGEAHRMEVYVIDEDRFYTITGEPMQSENVLKRLVGAVTATT